MRSLTWGPARIWTAIFLGIVLVVGVGLIARAPTAVAAPSAPVVQSLTEARPVPAALVPKSGFVKMGNANSVVCNWDKLPSWQYERPLIAQTIYGQYFYVDGGRCFNLVNAVYSEASAGGLMCWNQAGGYAVHWGYNRWTVLWNNTSYTCTYHYYSQA